MTNLWRKRPYYYFDWLWRLLNAGSAVNVCIYLHDKWKSIMKISTLEHDAKILVIIKSNQLLSAVRVQTSVSRVWAAVNNDLNDYYKTYVNNLLAHNRFCRYNRDWKHDAFVQSIIHPTRNVQFDWFVLWIEYCFRCIDL